VSVNGHTRVIVCDICADEQAVTRLRNGDGICASCVEAILSSEPVRVERHPFATFGGRATWFWGRYRSYRLPLWWVAREWLRCELGRFRP
jgi:hypothetical protein